MTSEVARSRSGAEELFDGIVAGGWAGLDAWREEKRAEDYLLEFKPHGADAPTLNAFDKSNIAKAVSGFANASGGVLIIGVSTKNYDGADHFEKLAPTAGVAAYAAAIGTHLSRCTDPRVPGARAVAIAKPGTDEGVVVIVVPPSDGGPHRAKSAKYETGDGHTVDFSEKYFHRQGAQTLVLEHPLLAAMFGRRPAPKLLLRTRIEAGLVVGFWLRNVGRGAARDIVLQMSVVSVANLVEREAVPTALTFNSIEPPWQGVWTRRLEQKVFRLSTITTLYPGDEMLVGLLDVRPYKFVRIVARIDADGMQPVSVSQPYDPGQRGPLEDNGRPHVDLFLREEEE